MTTAPASGTSRIGLLLLVAVLLGLSAALLFTPPAQTTGLQLFSNPTAPTLPPWFAPGLIVGLFALMVAILVARRFAYGGNLAGSFVVVGFLSILVGIGLYLVLRAVTHGATPTNSTAGGVHNSTPPPPPPGGGLGSGALAPPPTADAYLLIGLVVVAGLAAAVLLPRYLAYRRESRVSPEGPSPSLALGELQAALARLHAGGSSADPRARIIRAYGSLLSNVATGLPNLDTSTPREIERNVARVYRIRPATAHVLTELFEEARYAKARPLGPEAVERAESALRQALSELGPAAPRPA